MFSSPKISEIVNSTLFKYVLCEPNVSIILISINESVIYFLSARIYGPYSNFNSNTYTNFNTSGLLPDLI